jgi:hypothetical protein
MLLYFAVTYFKTPIVNLYNCFPYTSRVETLQAMLVTASQKTSAENKWFLFWSIFLGFILKYADNA